MKFFRLIPLVACLWLAVVPGLPGQASEPEPDVIRMAIVNANYRVALEELIAEYEALNPHIDVQLNFITQSYATWIRTRIAAGGDMVPDIYNGAYTAGYERLGKWVTMTDYLESINPYTGEPWIDTFHKPFIYRYQVDGELYQIPIDTIEIAMFYNKEIFAEVGVEVPRTWGEFLEVCRKIKAAGHTPIAIGGNASSFWEGDMGWLIRILCDAYLRSHVPAVMARPGDSDYDASRNEGFVYDGDAPYNDLMTVINNERLMQAVLDGVIDPRNEDFRRVYERLYELSGYFQEGYLGSDGGMAIQMFYRQDAAMIMLSSAAVTSIVNDFKQGFAPEDRFEWGNFWFPPITDDPLVDGPFRGVGGVAMAFAAMKQGTIEHERNVVDFLMFLTTPRAGEILVKRTLGDNQPLNGPLSIRDVELPPELAAELEVFQNRGYEKIAFRGLEGEQESVFEWSVIAQEYMGGRMSLDEFSEEYARILREAVPRLNKELGRDMDPTTPDSPEVFVRAPNRWNPFENGGLMLVIIVGLFAGFAAVQLARTRGARRRQTAVAYLMLFPAFFLLGAFSYFPALSGLYHAFTEWEEGRSAVFNGLENFRAMLGDKVLFEGMGNMLLLLVTGLIKATIIPFIGAEMILYLMSDRLRYVFRTLFMIPMVVPGMVTLLIWAMIFNPNMGLLNQGLALVGLDHLQSAWLGEPALALPSIIFMGFPWIGGPGMIGLLIFMAGLLNLSSSVYESFRIESDSVLRRIMAIDLPLMRSQFRLLVVLTFIGAVQDFQTILILTDGGPGLATTVPALRLYHQAFRFTHYGYGAAIGLVLFVFILATTMLVLKYFKPTESE